MIWLASSKHRSIRTARIWNSASPAVATACRGPASISLNGWSSAGLSVPAMRSHAAAPKPVTQVRCPSRSRNPTARTRPARSAHRSRTVATLFSPGVISTTRKIAAPVSGAATACGSGAAPRVNDAVTACGSGAAAPPVSVVTRLSSTVRRSSTEPLRHVEAEPAERDHRAQVSLECGQPLGAQLAGPLRAQVLEDRRRPGECVDAARGEPDQFAAGVAGVGGAFGIAKLLQPVDRLAGGLLGDAEQAAHLAGG